MVESGVYGWQSVRGRKSSGSGSVIFTNSKDKNKFETLQLSHIAGWFYFSFIGFGVAICAFIYEICSNKLQCMKRTQVGPNFHWAFVNARPSSLY